MFNKLKSTPHIERVVQDAVDKWKAGNLHGRDLTNIIVPLIENDCDDRFAAFKISELAATVPAVAAANSPMLKLLCDIKELLLNQDTPDKESRSVIITRINAALAQLQQ
jgi:hypothetical protein